MPAKQFFYVCCGVLLLVAAYHLGATRAVAQGQELQVGNAFPSGCGVAGRVVYVMRRDGSGQPVAMPDPLPGDSPAVGVWAETPGSLDVHAYVVLANGDLLEGTYGYGWTRTGNLFAGGPTATKGTSWGKVKADYRK